LEVLMEWKPKRWVAVVLSLVSSALGLLYIGKPRWAIGFGVFSLVCATGASVVPDLSFLMYVVTALWLALPVVMFFTVRSVVLPVRPWYSRAKGMITIACAIVIPILTVRIFLYEPFKAPSLSMEPTLPQNSIMLVQKAGFGHFSTYGIKFGHGSSVIPAHGDLIVFDFPRDPQQTYVKRLIGLPGDVVKVEGTQVTLNGKPSTIKQLDDFGRVEEQFEGVHHTILAKGMVFPYWENHEFPGREQCRSTESSIECRVPAGHYFVLGDNRNNSADSRVWGFVPADNVIGKVVKVFEPT